MKYNNRLFPHPVLGISDDVAGEFVPELVYKSDSSVIELNVTFKLINESLLKLIKDQNACFVTQVYCRATMFREVFMTTSTIDTIKIEALKLNSDVEVHFFICASTGLTHYRSETFNQEYEKARFNLDECDILAYGGKAIFIANKSPEELRSISSLIRVRNSFKSSCPMIIEYDGEKIEILLSKEDYEGYETVVKNRMTVNFIHSAIVLPALIDALYYIEKKESGDLKQRRWYKALSDIKEKSKTKDCFQIAQNILDQPNDRAFNFLLNLLEE